MLAPYATELCAICGHSDAAELPTHGCVCVCVCARVCFVYVLTLITACASGVAALYTKRLYYPVRQPRRQATSCRCDYVWSYTTHTRTRTRIPMCYQTHFANAAKLTQFYRVTIRSRTKIYVFRSTYDAPVHPSPHIRTYAHAHCGVSMCEYYTSLPLYTFYFRVFSFFFSLALDECDY